MDAKTETILLVDDEASDRGQMRRALELDGHTVLEAPNYESALRIFRDKANVIGLLVTDISLPGNNGCELAKAILKLKPDLKVLFVSGHVGAEVCKFYGIPVTDLHFLQKPFQPAELSSRVKQVLSSREALPGFGRSEKTDQRPRSTT